MEIQNFQQLNFSCLAFLYNRISYDSSSYLSCWFLIRTWSCIFGLPGGSDPAAHFPSVGHSLFLHAADAGNWQSGNKDYRNNRNIKLQHKECCSSFDAIFNFPSCPDVSLHRLSSSALWKDSSPRWWMNSLTSSENAERYSLLLCALCPTSLDSPTSHR